MSFAVNKQPTLLREPMIPELVIPDLQMMERSGNYKRDVLLWLQDGYANKAMAQHMPELMQLEGALADADSSEGEIRRQRMQAIVDFTKETYTQAKEAGGGADIRTYIEAAKTFYEAEAARYGSHLKELAEYIEKALANGERPDIERHARHCYVSMAKLSSVQQQMESMSGRQAAQQVAQMIKQGVETIGFNAVGDVPTHVGRQMLRFVEQISQNPAKYIEYRDPSRMTMPPREPWDFEPTRQATMSYGIGY
ncbi:hypothetical protein [Xanthomonas oryzae]|uniref:hypothetical protein n=1 Tax=Xanthomonas oryzae TaxID=347 RepID=UPI003D9FDB8F